MVNRDIQLISVAFHSESSESSEIKEREGSKLEGSCSYLIDYQPRVDRPR